MGGFRPSISVGARTGWNAMPFVQVNLTGEELVQGALPS